MLRSCWNSIVITCQQACYKPVAKSLVDMLLEQHCHNLLTRLLQVCFGVILLTSCWNSIFSTCQQTCYKPVEESSCRQVVGTAFYELVNKLATSLLTSHLVDKLLEQHFLNLLASLLQAC
jgi:hypothetical protein